MHLRIRPSPTNPATKRVFAVRAGGEEVPDPASQRRWDNEQLSQQKASDLDNNSQHPCFIQKIPKSVIFPHSPSNFVVEFMDLSCMFVFMIHGGGAQWYFKNTSTETYTDKGRSYSALPLGFEFHWSPFFSNNLVSITQSTFKNLAALWEGRLNTGLCNDAPHHRHYILKLLVGLTKDGEIPHFRELKYTLHVVCENTKVTTLFDGLCKHKLNDSFSMTWLLYCQSEVAGWFIGASYTHFMAKLLQPRIENLGWGDDNDEDTTQVWVLPLPCEGASLGNWVLHEDVEASMWDAVS
ncbi:uncharacterized protein H6S33_009383 [Morchella sextelata]|uniref:uncharacterized protein n=1 Tax=Morchella sextelata TaxID=1174677 RepID=UPI001D03C071|nr:uncharacterized protein H6S33_009383 [Morchella sextelata]KAH0613003.1 hypothetical protein H6S33_009383 [Morchella sextelata]